MFVVLGVLISVLGAVFGNTTVANIGIAPIGIGIMLYFALGVAWTVKA